jgi:hypothetical protein
MAARSYRRYIDHATAGDNQCQVEIVNRGADMSRDQVEGLPDLRRVRVHCNVDGQMLLAWLLRPEIRAAKYRAGGHTLIS